MSRPSISLRLTLWFTAVFLCGFVILSVAMWAGWAYTLSSGRDRTIARRATRAFDVLANNANLSQAALASRYDEFVDSTPEGNMIEISDALGRVLFPRNPLAPAGFPWPRPSASGGDTLENRTYLGREFRVIQHPVEFNGEHLIVRVAGQLEDNRQMLARFTRGLIETIPVLLVATALAGYFMSRRVLRPVGRLTAAVRSLTIGNLAERLPISKTGDELQRLAETCNDMLARLETAVVQIKRFTADASHELRSPLSFISMVSECALRNPDYPAECREVFEDILAESKEATHLLEDGRRRCASGISYRFGVQLTNWRNYRYYETTRHRLP